MDVAERRTRKTRRTRTTPADEATPSPQIKAALGVEMVAPKIAPQLSVSMGTGSEPDDDNADRG